MKMRTRAQAALAMGATSSPARTQKRRKIRKNMSHRRPKFTTTSSSFVHRSSRGLAAVTTVVLAEPVTEERCSIPTSDELTPSCSSSNGSVGRDEERIKLLDVKVGSAQVEMSTCNCGEEAERREMSSSSKVREDSEEVESEETNSSRTTSRAQNMPTEMELEEFFATAEKDIQKRFQDKYNYDFVKDVPLEGRFEWVQLKP